MDSLFATTRELRPICVASITSDPGLHQAISSELASDPRTMLVGSARSLREGLSIPALAVVDVAILDEELPDGCGLDLMVHLKKVNPGSQAIILAGRDDDRAALRAFGLGAAGWLARSSRSGSFSMAVQTVHEGGCALSWTMARRLILPGEHSQPLRSRSQPSARLTARERDVVRYLASGLASKEIAREMGICPDTVSFHLKSIYRKFQAHSRTQLLRVATDTGYLSR